jgi:Mg-chelatase subunit ChlD
LNLAFIDIMSCGLGAIVLVFILVKPDVAATVLNENSRLEAELESVRSQENKLHDEIDKTREQADRETAANQSVNAEIQRLKNELSRNKNLLAQQASRVSEVKQSITDRPIKKSGDVVSDDNRGEEEYLLGLSVEGDRIAFLIDTSASMTDERLIDIIKRKSGTDQVRKSGPKWLRTQRVARWLLSRLPKSAQVSVVSYSDKAKFLGGADWHQASNPGGIKKILQELDAIVPSGPTNLHKGLLKVKSLSPRISNLYVITDGLPTTGQSRYAGLNPFSSCYSLLGRSNTISGACRAKLFRQTIIDTSSGFNPRVNVVLLPLEGDPEASPNYWEWTAATGGLLISPAGDWP